MTAIALSASAHADDQPEESVRVRVRPSPLREEHGPWLTLDDAVLGPNLEPFDAIRDRETTTIAIGGTKLALEGDWWTAGNDVPEHGISADRDIPGHGWRAAVRLSRDLGLVRVSGSATLGHVESRYGEGNYSELSVSIVRTVRLSRWMTGWISVTAGRRRWLGKDPPPAGERDATQVMLSIGTTFR